MKEICFTYDSDTRTVPGRKGAIQVESLIPRLSDEERAERRRYIGERLSGILERYGEGRK